MTKEQTSKEQSLNERPVIVVGHKNPDTDSVCSAIAYADFKNRNTVGKHHVPMRAGAINAETKFVLEYFGVPVPKFTGDVGTQVKDMEIRRTPGVSKDTTLQEAWRLMGENEAVTQPITEDGKIIGLITKGDIAKTLMDSQDEYFLAGTSPTYKNIADSIGGEILIGDPQAKFEKGKVIVGAAEPEHMKKIIEEGDLVILVDRADNHLAAIQKGAGCIVLCLDAAADESTVEMAKKAGTVIIRTDLDTYSVAIEINKSVPVGAFMITGDIVTFKTDDYTDDVLSVMSSTRHRAFPVADSKGEYIGTVSRRNFLGMKKKEVILVDHNEQSQAVDNIDEADILEIVDHHRIGTLQTLQPIYFVNQPVGCTATIIYQMYLDKRCEIDPTIAGLLLAAIISDTLMFRSPTCTTLDKMAAGGLALIADIDIESFAEEMFKAGSDLADKTPEEVFYQDYKIFSFGDKQVGVGQISSMSKDELDAIKVKLDSIIEESCTKNNTDMAFFMLTNIRESSSELIYAGEDSEALIKRAFKNAQPTDGGYMVEGLLSRKKQLVPAFIRSIDND